MTGVVFKGKRTRELSADAAVSVVDVYKSYRGAQGQETRVLDDIDLDIRRGEFFSLLGPSGCGKTTTLRMINRLIEPTAGTIRIAGRDVREVPPHLLRRLPGAAHEAPGLAGGAAQPRDAQGQPLADPPAPPSTCVTPSTSATASNGSSSSCSTASKKTARVALSH